MKFYSAILHPLLAMLNPVEKRKGVWVIVLMVFTALLDFFSLASFLPLFALLVNPGFISTNKYAALLYDTLGFSSPAWFIGLLAITVLILTLLKNVIALRITRSKAAYTFTLGSHLSSRMLSKYIAISYLRFTQLDFSKELNRIANLPIAFANNVIMPIGTLISEGLVFMLLLFCIAFYDIKVFAFLCVILVPAGLLYRMKRISIKETSLDLKEKWPLTLKYALQAVEGLSEIRVFGKEQFFKNRFTTISESLAKTFVRDHTTQSGTSRLTEIIAAFIVCSLIVYSLLLDKNYQKTIILLGLYAGASFRIIPSLNRILNASLQIKTHEYLFHELEELSNPEPPNSTTPKSEVSFNDNIQLDDISFSYPGGPNVLDHVSFTVRKGEKIALVGRSGSGKTTLLLILLRFLSDHSGKILLDGKEIGIENYGAFRPIFSYVPQSPYMIDGSILENIAFGVPAPNIDHEKIRQLIHDLDLDEIIGQLPDGLATQIGERGIKLSGGQRQRIAIARALYADAEVLLLDEITNQLDAKTEQEIVKSLEKVAQQKKTIIMITHHNDLLKHFDQVLKIENGILSELNVVQSLTR
ncbi:MAG TPA: ABC transporter ATP-binding protein [Chryseolinea sp.]|nr:ABC transporter ATP-binding protein [Chryseolinea sp.]